MNLHAAGRRLSDAERVDWLRLIRSENVGPQTFHELLRHFGSAAAALEALPALSGRGGLRRRIALASRAAAEDELARAARTGCRVVALGEPDYPPALARLDAPPPLLTVRGAPDILQRPAVALVGSRNASLAGKKICRQLARQFGDQDFVIVSGLARGIDAAAHEAALATGTIAVLAGGQTRIYPEEHAGLAERIADSGGALVSEMPLDWICRAQDFPRRNRLVSGLSAAVVVVEAARRSGSLITARFALEQNRDVYAVPGSPLDPRAEGCNALIKQGARLITEAADVLSDLGPTTPVTPPQWAREDDERVMDEVPGADGENVHDRLLEALGPVPVAIDDLVRELQLSAGRVQLALVELELAGRLERHSGGRISLA